MMYSNGLSDASGILTPPPALWAAQITQDWQNLCAQEEKPLVNQYLAKVDSMTPGYAWSSPCVSLAKWEKKMLRQTRSRITCTPHAINQTTAVLLPQPFLMRGGE